MKTVLKGTWRQKFIHVFMLYFMFFLCKKGLAQSFVEFQSVFTKLQSYKILNCEWS